MKSEKVDIRISDTTKIQWINRGYSEKCIKKMWKFDKTDKFLGCKIKQNNTNGSPTIM
jgi:hypothetical protein